MPRELPVPEVFPQAAEKGAPAVPGSIPRQGHCECYGAAPMAAALLIPLTESSMNRVTTAISWSE